MVLCQHKVIVLTRDVDVMFIIMAVHILHLHFFKMKKPLVYTRWHLFFIYRPILMIVDK